MIEPIPLLSFPEEPYSVLSHTQLAESAIAYPSVSRIGLELKSSLHHRFEFLEYPSSNEGSKFIH